MKNQTSVYGNKVIGTNKDKPAMPCRLEALEQHKALGVAQDTNEIGLTKREYFAGLAMQGICANGAYNQVGNEEYHAKRAAVMADALLAELEKEQ